MQIKDPQDIAGILESIKPKIRKEFKSELRNSILLQSTESAGSLSLWEKLKMNFKFYTNIMKLNPNLKFGFIVIVILTFTVVGVRAYPGLYKLFDCSNGRGTCYEFLGEMGFDGFQQRLGIDSSYPMSEEEVVEQLNYINVNSTIHNKSNSVRQMLSFPILLEKDGFKVHTQEIEQYPQSLPQIYIENDEFVFVADILQPVRSRSDFEAEVDGILERIKNRDYGNPTDIVKQGDLDSIEESYKDFLLTTPDRVVVDGYTFIDPTVGGYTPNPEEYYFATFMIITPNNEVYYTNFEYAYNSELPELMNKTVERMKNNQFESK